MTRQDDIQFTWSRVYRPEWDEQPEQYINHGILAPGRSRRLGRVDVPDAWVKAYIGVQHFDPERWGLAGAAQARFFLSLFSGGRTVSMRVYPTIGDVLAELRDFVAATRAGVPDRYR